MAITWPDVLVPQQCHVNLRNFSASGGMTRTGRRQQVFNDAGFWEVRMLGVIVNTREKADAYRAMIALLRQGEEIAVPTFDCYGAIGGALSNSETTIKGDVDLRDTDIIITSSGVAIKPGSHFSVFNRLHRVTEVISGPVENPPYQNPLVADLPWNDEQPWTDDVTDTSDFRVKILPPLRANYSDGQSVRFAETRVTCVLKNPQDGDLELEAGRVGYPSLTFIESFT